MIKLKSHTALNEKLIVILVIYFAAFQAIFAQEQISFNQLSVEDGLSQSSVISITQDSTGYLWFATQDGLNKYDGKQFTYYPKLFSDITKNKFSELGKIYVDRMNNLWIIPLSGIPEKMNSKEATFTPLAISPKSELKNISALFQDKSLNFWFGTYGNGLYKKEYSTGVITQVTAKGFSDIYSISMEDDQNILICADSVLLRININTLAIKEIPVKDRDNKKVQFGFNCIVKDKEETLWLGTFGSGLFYKTIKDDSFRPFAPFEDKSTINLPENLTILSVLIDKKNRLWVGTFGEGAYLLDFENRSIKNFKANRYNSKVIHQNDILSLYEDYTGTIWLGTDGGGLSYYDENLSKFNSRTTTQIPTNINIDFVRAITKDNSGKIWLGTFNNGLSSYDPKTEQWKTYLPDNSSINSTRILSLWSEEDELWIGTYDQGLNILSKNRFLKFNKNSDIKLEATRINCIFKDSKDRYWLGTRSHGLLLFDKEKGVLGQYLYSPSESNSIPGNNIIAIKEGKNNNLWIGTVNNGFSKFNPQTEVFTNYHTNTKNSNSIYYSKIKSIYYDTNEIVWVGTNGGGLTILDIKNETLYNYGTKQGLPNNVIYAILPDDNGNLWLSSNKGISKLQKPKKLGGKLSITDYDNSDGLQSLEFNTGAYFKDNQGYLYFGGLNGFNWINPNKISTNSIAPKTIISRVEIFNKERPIVQKTEFSAKENTISFTFSALHFSQPNNNTYQYQLVNHDENWIASGNKNYANYTNLAPGEYTFRVKSANYDGVWNEEPALYQFSILNHWYLSNLAYFIYAILFLIVVYGIFSYFRWKWNIQLKLQVEHEETKRLKEMDSFKNKFFENISHEFRTPLTLIKLPISQAIKTKEKLTEAHLSIIDNNTSHLQNLIEDLLLISELEEGKSTINKTEQNPLNQIEILSSQFDSFVESKGMFYTKIIENTKINASYDKSVVEKVVKNLISNAVKNSRKGDRIQINANLQNQNLVIEVKDTGKGISKENQEKIFDRFFQVDEKNEHTKGSGIGLSLVKKIVELNHGKVSVESELNKGSTFLVTLPMENLVLSDGSVLVKTKIEEASLTIKNSEDYVDAVQISNKPQLLIVEDNIELLEFIEGLFRKNFIIHKAVDGKMGLEKAIELVPDIIISDWMMPELNGIDFCEKVKTNSITSHIPFVMLTAKADIKDKVKGYETGADAYFSKPFNFEELQAQTNSLIQQRKILIEKFSDSNNLIPEGLTVNSRDVSFWEEFKSYLKENIKESDLLSTARFSEHLGMSRMQLHRKLTALTGKNLTDFIKNQRMNLACELLKDKSLLISDVCYEIGYEDKSAFGRVFKQEFGVSPTQFRENLK